MKLLSKILNNIPNINRFERIWKIAQIDFKKRYYNDRLGLIWALLNPIMSVSVYYIVFTMIMNRVSEGIDNYALFIFSGLIFWIAFVEMLKKGMKTLISKSYLIENIKLNKIDLYLSICLSISMALIFNISAYLIMAKLFGVNYSYLLLYLPILILNIFLIGCGTSMILSVVLIHFRDINHIVDIAIKLGFWTSGIFFKAELILDKLPFVYYINPFVGIIENARNIALYNTCPNLVTMNLNVLIGIFIFIIGAIYVERFGHLACEKL